MRQIGAVFTLAFLVMVPTLAFCGMGVISTKATGEASVFPDQVTIGFEISSSGESPVLAANETALKYRSVIEELADHGFKENEVVSIRFQVNERVEYNQETRKTERVGYFANHVFQVVLNDFTKIGPIVDNVLNAGASKMAKISFTTSRLEEIQNAALEQAVERILVKAEIMARTAGGELGPLLEMDSSREREQIVNLSAGGEPQSVPTTLVPDMIRVSVYVTAKWEFQSRGE